MGRSKEDTERFLRLMNEQNERIAEREAQEEAAKQKALQGDPVRNQMMAEKREKWGILRAREHPSKRPITARHLFKSNLSN